MLASSANPRRRWCVIKCGWDNVVYWAMYFPFVNCLIWPVFSELDHRYNELPAFAMSRGCYSVPIYRNWIYFISIVNKWAIILAMAMSPWRILLPLLCKSLSTIFFPHLLVIVLIATVILFHFVLAFRDMNLAEWNIALFPKICLQPSVLMLYHYANSVMLDYHNIVGYLSGLLLRHPCNLELDNFPPY